jgi:hypothetical protein
MSNENNVLTVKTSCARSAVILTAIKKSFKRGFNEPIEEDIPEGQLSMAAILFPVFNPDEEVQS